MSTKTETQTHAQEIPIPYIEARIDKLFDGSAPTKAIASVTIAGAFAVHGLKVIESEKGSFIAMPQESYKSNGEKKYSDIFHAITAEARMEIIAAVCEAYEQKLEEQAQRQRQTDAPGMTMGM